MGATRRVPCQRLPPHLHGCRYDGQGLPDVARHRLGRGLAGGQRRTGEHQGLASEGHPEGHGGGLGVPREHSRHRQVVVRRSPRRRSLRRRNDDCRRRSSLVPLVRGAPGRSGARRAEDAHVMSAGIKISVVEGDITEQQVDAVVNAANRRMRGGSGVDGAIHSAGGREILEDCIARFPEGLPTGQAGWTTAGRLPARWVIHVVGPNFTAGERDRSLLTSCYANALHVADELGATTVAFPLVSAGVYGWPREDAVDAAVDTLRSTATQVEEARLVAYSRDAHDLIAAA